MEGKQRFVLNLPPGYHFAPTDAELIVHYLRRKMDGVPPHLPIFNDVTPIIDYRPEQITDEFRDCGEGSRWYFFTKRNRKYATGNRLDRTTPGKGFWKATGPVRLIRPGGKLVGRARTLVFYTGPDEATYWTMHEYENLTSEAEANDKNIDKLGEWVLCTIQKSHRCDEKKEEGGKAKGKAGGRKRKGKAQSGTDQVQIQSPEVPEMAWPEKKDEMYLFDLEQTSCPKKRPQMQQHELPETMMVDDYDYGQNMGPTQEPPRSEMMVSHYGGNMGSAGSPPSMSWQGPLLWGSEMVSRSGTAYNWDGYMPPPLGYNGYSMPYYQPATSYLPAAVPLGASGCGGAAHYGVKQDGYAGGHYIPCTFRPQHSYAAGVTNLSLSTGATNGQVEP